MINTQLQSLRHITQETMGILSISKAGHNGDMNPFLEEQISILRKALNDAATPEHYRVAIVGSFKVGKSSFINVLCNTTGLASVDTNPETAAITLFKYGINPQAKIHLISRDEWEAMKESFEEDSTNPFAARYKEIKRLDDSGKLTSPLAEIETRYINSPSIIESIECYDWQEAKQRKEFNKRLKQFTSRRNPLHYLVDHIEVFVPVPLLQDGIELIDTPGLDDTDRYRVRLTEKCVDDVDVILFLTQSGSSYSQSNKDFILQQLRKQTIKHLRIIITKCDQTFSEAIKNAEESDEDLPTFSQHIEIEEQRLREQINLTLNELLDEINVSDDESGYYYIKQLDNIPINFISSRYHLDKNYDLSGIDALRNDVRRMLAESERITAACKTLRDALARVHERTLLFFRTRLDAIETQFDKNAVRNQLHNIEKALDKELRFFNQVAQGQIDLFAKRIETDTAIIEAELQNLLLQSEIIVSNYERDDVAKHWRTRRSGYWGYMYDLANKVADRGFPILERMLRRYTSAFQETLGSIRETLTRFQNNLLNLQKEFSLSELTEPINLTDSFDSHYKELIDDINMVAQSQKDIIVSHLDDFLSDEVSAKLMEARSRVKDVWGRGTTVRQTSEVIDFYDFFKRTIKNALKDHVTNQINKFTNTLKEKASLVFPEVQLNLKTLIDERIAALEVSLIERTEQQREVLINILRTGLTQTEAINQQFVSLEQQDHATTGRA